MIIIIINRPCYGILQFVIYILYTLNVNFDLWLKIKQIKQIKLCLLIVNLALTSLDKWAERLLALNVEMS